MQTKNGKYFLKVKREIKNIKAHLITHGGQDLAIYIHGSLRGVYMYSYVCICICHVFLRMCTNNFCIFLAQLRIHIFGNLLFYAKRKQKRNRESESAKHQRDT